MKIVLVVLILCFFVNFVDAFSWFNFRWNQPPKQVTKTTSTQRLTSPFHQSTFQQQNLSSHRTNSIHQVFIPANKNNKNSSPLQRAVHQLQYQVRNTTAIQRQADSVNKNIQFIPRNRFQAMVYQQQYRSRNHSSTFRPVNDGVNNTNNRILHPRFRYFLLMRKNHTTGIHSAIRRMSLPTSGPKSTGTTSKLNSSLVLRNNVPLFRRRFTRSRPTVPNTKAVLFRHMTTKAVENMGSQNRQHPFDEFYYQQRLKALDQPLNEGNVAYRPFNRNSILRKRKREDPDIPTMIFVRDLPTHQDDSN